MSGSSLTSQSVPARLYFRVPPQPSHLLRARERIRDYLRQYCTDHEVIDDIVLCVEEACTNAIRHSGAAQDIEISLQFDRGCLEALVKDGGRGFDVTRFDPQRSPDPRADHGRGLFIMAALMDSFELSSDGGLEVRMARRAEPRCEPAPLESGLGAPQATGGRGRREARTRAMLEEIDEAFFALDWEYRYVHANRVALQFAGKPLDELLGHTPWELFPQLQGSPLVEHYRQAMELGMPCVFEHCSVVSGDWLEVRIYPTPAGVSAYYREINERKRREDELVEAQAQTEQELRATSQLLEAADALAEWRDLGEVVRRLAQTALRSTSHSRVIVDLWDEARDEIEVVASEGLQPLPLGSRWPIGEVSLAARQAIAERQTQLGDFEALPKAQRGRAAAPYLARLTLHVPLVRRDKTVGLLVVDDPGARGQFSAREIQVVEGIASQAAVAIDNARLFEELHHSRERESFLADVVEQAEVAFGVGAADGRLIFFNQAFADLTGYAREELEERALTWAVDLTPKEWRETEAALLAEAVEARRVVRYEKEYVRKDGSRVPVELVVQPIFGDDGNLLNYRSFVADISERKWAEEALRQSARAARQAEERYRNLFDTLIEGFCVIEMIFADGNPVDYRFLEINRAFEEQTGLHDAQGKLMRDLAPDHEQHWFDIYGKVALTGEAARFMAPAAALGRYYDVSAFRVGGQESHQVGIVFNDISERHRAEEERQRLLDESLAQAEELQTQSEELRAQGEELKAHYDEQLVQRAALLRENELRAGLNAIGELLHSTLEPGEVMRRALGEATRALAIDAAAIELNEGGAWPTRYSEGLPVEALGAPLIGEPVIARLVADAGEALVLDDVTLNEMVGPFASRHGIRSLMAVPLLARDEILGVLLLVERRAVRHFEPAEIDFAHRLGSLVGLAIENARLFKAEADAARLATVLNEMNGLINSTLDAREIMQTVVEQAVAAVGADSAMVALRHGDDWVAEYGYPEVPGVIHESVRTDEAPFMVAAVTERRPIAIDDCETDPRCLPEVQRRFGVRSVLCLPLIVKEQVLGVIFFNHHEAAVAFPPAIVEFAARLARALSIALANAQLYEAQRNIATTLQENFIHELPAVAGLELGVVSRTANEPELVGGDFSDVFVVDDTHVVAIIGDVAGKGVRAAGLTETVRSTVRALAAVDCSPAFVLAKTNELLLRFDPDEPHVTAFLAVLDPHTGHLGYASAGHPAPIHLGAFSCRQLDVAFGPPLGSFERPYTNSHAMLTLEDYLVLYTDGVTEARRDGELLGEQRLLEIVSGLRGCSAQEVAERVRDAALEFGGQLRDDLQVVVLRLA